MLESAFTARIINSYDQKGTTEGTSYFDAFKDDLKNNFSCTSTIRLVPHFSKKGITFLCCPLCMFMVRISSCLAIKNQTFGSIFGLLP